MVQVLHIRLREPGTHESHITDVRWYDPKSGNMNLATVAAMVKFIAEDHGRAYMFDGQHYINIEAVLDSAPPYIKAHAESGSQANLLSLPTF